MKLLVTGKNGFIGRNLMEYYQQFSDIEILGTDRETDMFIALREFKPDIIIHTGAEIYDDDKMFTYNVISSKIILDYCREFQVSKLIIFGSSSEYGRKLNKINETDFLEPQTIYEATKGAVSLLAQGYSNAYGIPITIVRPFTIVGRYEKPHKFFPILYRSYKNNEPIKLSSAVHDFVFIDDFINAFNVILNYWEKEFTIVNIGSGIQTSNSIIVNAFEKVLDYKYEKIPTIGLRKFDSMNWVCDTTKLNTKYKIKFSTSIEDGIRKFCDDCEQLKLYQ